MNKLYRIFLILLMGAFLCYPISTLAQGVAGQTSIPAPVPTQDDIDGFMATISEQWAILSKCDPYATAVDDACNEAYSILALLINDKDLCHAPAPAPKCVDASGNDVYTTIADGFYGMSKPNGFETYINDQVSSMVEGCQLSNLSNMQEACNANGNDWEACKVQLQSQDFWDQVHEKCPTHIGCTSDVAFQEDTLSGATNILDAITKGKTVGDILQGTAITVRDTLAGGELYDAASGQLAHQPGVIQKIFESIVGAQGFLNAAGAAMALFLIIYAVGFMFGIVELSGEEAIIRLLKIGFITMLMTPAVGWQFFNDYVVTVFIDGTDEITNTMSGVGECIAFMENGQTGTCPVEKISPLAPGGAMDSTPLARVTATLDKLLSMKMLIIVISLLIPKNAGMMGMMFAAIIGFGIIIYVWAAVSAIWLYLISLVFRSLLLALGPIFLVFLLFERTRGLFTGWLKQLVSFSLQPMFAFAFISFFIAMMGQYIDRMMDVELCMGSLPDFIVGTPMGELPVYRFKKLNADGVYTTYDGDWGAESPIALIDALMFLLLSLLLWSFIPLASSLGSAVAGGGAALGEMSGMVGKALDTLKEWAKPKVLGKLPFVGGIFGGGK